MYKKNTILIFLLCLVAMPLFFSVYTIVEKKIIEGRMVEKMERENLQVITVDAASVIWLQDNKEILINGKPFDIRSISRNGNKLTISGLYDQREEKLQEQLETYNHAENSPSASGNSLLLLSFTIWYLPNHTIDLYTPFVVQSGQTLQKYQDNICRLNKQIIVPPPRCS